MCGHVKGCLACSFLFGPEPIIRASRSAGGSPFLDDRPEGDLSGGDAGENPGMASENTMKDRGTG